MPVLRADLEMQITICRFALRTDGAQLRSRGDSITKDKAALVPGPKYIDNVELAACDRQRHQAIDLVDRADGPGSDRVDGCSRIGGEVDTGMETTRVRTVRSVPGSSTATLAPERSSAFPLTFRLPKASGSSRKSKFGTASIAISIGPRISPNTHMSRTGLAVPAFSNTPVAAIVCR